MRLASGTHELLHPLFHRSIFAISSFLRASARTLRGDIATRVSQDGISGSSDDRRERLRRFSAAPREPSSSRRSPLPPLLPPQLTHHTASSQCSRSMPLAAPARSTLTFASVAIACSRSALASGAYRDSPTTRRSASAFARSSAARGASPRRSDLTRDEVARIARQAAAQAKANRAALVKPVVLAPAPVTKEGTWRSPAKIDPFDIPIEEKVALLLAANEAALKVQGSRFVNSAMFFLREEKTYANSEGTFTVQTIYRASPTMTVTAVSSGLLRLSVAAIDRHRADGTRLRARGRCEARRERAALGGGSSAEAVGEASRRRPIRSRAASDAPRAHDSRIDRASDRARSRATATKRTTPARASSRRPKRSSGNSDTARTS